VRYDTVLYDATQNNDNNDNTIDGTQQQYAMCTMYRKVWGTHLKLLENGSIVVVVYGFRGGFTYS
jgi:hypothetical protein